jgi:hypothetical protein
MQNGRNAVRSGVLSFALSDGFKSPAEPEPYIGHALQLIPQANNVTD